MECSDDAEPIDGTLANFYDEKSCSVDANNDLNFHMAFLEDISGDQTTNHGYLNKDDFRRCQRQLKKSVKKNRRLYKECITLN